ncbi:type II toxin-antitoxin system RelE/ParE family toxin [bacterium]|nr:type II toxin-antitoxin system RelE/ParE family toxin [bacterium]MBU1754550.1 type II toxin-antitoxin system RelE/ParE family toxin [bacterium]
MAWKVKWTEAAWNDLEEVSDYIAKDSPYYAATFVREVRDAARSLSYFAERGRVVPEFGNLSIRELFIRKYRLIYQLKEQTVCIIGFIHGARDLLALWERER